MRTKFESERVKKKKKKKSCNFDKQKNTVIKVFLIISEEKNTVQTSENINARNVPQGVEIVHYECDLKQHAMTRGNDIIKCLEAFVFSFTYIHYIIIFQCFCE